jgi:RNA polymerase sigma-70 factor (ECF subfamily)
VAVTEHFSRYRKRLKRMVRLNRQLLGRLDDSDILQEALLEVAKRLPEYLADKPLPFFLWLRHISGQKLIDAHRRHLGAKFRDAAHEVSLHRGAMPAASSASLATQLLGRLTSPSPAAIKAEARLRVQEVLNSMERRRRHPVHRRLARRQVVAELRGHAAYVHGVTWSPDGARLVSGSGDLTERVWDSVPAGERVCARESAAAPGRAR